MRICRSCLKIITTSECYSLNQPYPNSECILLKKKCKACIPELDLDLTTDAVLCGPCYDTFNLFYHLRLRCLEMQERIRHSVREKLFVDLSALALQNQAIEAEHLVNLQSNSVGVVKTEPEQSINANDDAEVLEKVSNEHAEPREGGSEAVFENEIVPCEPSSGGDETSALRGNLQKSNITNQQNSSEIGTVAQSGSSAEFVENKFIGRMQWKFKCSQCDYKTSKRINLEKHKKLHKYNKPFVCKECGYAALESWLLQSHIAMHAASKSYKCKECSYKTTYRSNLMIHVRNHTGEKSYCCSICKKSYTQNSSLIRHMKKHSETDLCKCPQCAYQTFDKSHFYNHLKLHSAKKLYMCHTCDKKFATKSTLIRHVGYHAMYHSAKGEDKYKNDDLESNERENLSQHH